MLVHRPIQLTQTNSWAEKLLSRVNRPFAKYGFLKGGKLSGSEKYGQIVVMAFFAGRERFVA
jgi:hypothetical protein